MTSPRDPGMDQSPDVWQSPEIDPNWPAVPHEPPAPEDVRDPVGEVTHFASAGDMHAESIAAIARSNAALARLVLILTGAGLQIVTLQPGAVAASQHIRFRLQYIIVSRATAGDAVLTLGTVGYTFTVGAVPATIDFPLVIERGTDMLYTGDGRMYLVGWPE